MRAYECGEGVGGKVARPVAPPIATKAAMADGLLDWAYHSNHTLPGTAAASLVAANRQLVQAVGGFGLCFFGQHFALTVAEPPRAGRARGAWPTRRGESRTRGGATDAGAGGAGSAD